VDIIINHEKLRKRMTKMNFTNISNLNQSLGSNDTAPFALTSYFSDTEAAALVSVSAFFGLVGFLLNLLLILSTILTDGFAEQPVNLFVLSLACADLLLCSVSVPLYIYNCYSPIFSIFITASRLNAMATTGSIFLLSLNRFISIVKDLNYPKIMTFKITAMLVGAIWFIAILSCVMSVVGLTWDMKPIARLTRYFISFYVILSVVMHAYMYKLARKHRQQLRQQAFAVTGQTQARSDEFKALRSLFMIAGSFAACWLPIAIQPLVYDTNADPVQGLRIFLFLCPLCIVNAVIDPIVFYYRSKGFRVSLGILARRFKNAGYCECL
jgi:hypothetical protein